MRAQGEQLRLALPPAVTAEELHEVRQLRDLIAQVREELGELSAELGQRYPFGRPRRDSAIGGWYWPYLWRGSRGKSGRSASPGGVRAG
jgi:hypothetical protein